MPCNHEEAAGQKIVPASRSGNPAHMAGSESFVRALSSGPWAVAEIELRKKGVGREVVGVVDDSLGGGPNAHKKDIPIIRGSERDAQLEVRPESWVHKS